MDTLIPVGAGLVQNEPLSTLAVILVTVVLLHIISVNFLVPKLIGQRVSISPVASTMGILLWGWLWGVMGVLLAVPLTALVKIVADLHPSNTLRNTSESSKTQANRASPKSFRRHPKRLS